MKKKRLPHGEVKPAVSLSRRIQAGATLLSLLISTGATAAVSPEAQSARIARTLRGIPNDEWNRIAGDRITEKYEVLKGDTLYDISGRLFGDTKYWPKIWELNNPQILNPHFIYPKHHLTFQSGSGSSLPGLYLGDVADRVGETDYEIRNVPGTNLLAEGPGPRWDEKTPKPRAEWQKLPKQSWENINIALPPEVDRDGFDQRSFVNRGRAMGDELPYLMACEKVEPAGYIEGSRDPNRFLVTGNEITIRPNIAELGENQTYSVLGTPLLLTNVDRREKRRKKEDAREALAYPVTGKARILGVNEGVYVGELRQVSSAIHRGDIIHAPMPRVRITENINGPSPVQGKVLVDPANTTYVTAQYKWVFIDRGTNDGVKKGMIFRIFQYKDPLTTRNLSNIETLVEGDAQVYASCSNFSLARVIWSRDGIDNGTHAILLTDVSEYHSRYYMNGNVMPQDLNAPMPEPTPSPVAADESPEPITDADEALPVEELPGEGLPSEESAPPQPEGDWLDDLDNNQGLSGEEEKELQQLEKYEEPPPPAEELSPEGVAPVEELPPEEGAPLEEAPPIEGEVMEVPADNLPPAEEPYPAEEPPPEDEIIQL